MVSACQDPAAGTVQVGGAGCLPLVSRSSDTHVCDANDGKTPEEERMQATANTRTSSVVLQIYVKSTRSPSWLKFPLLVQSITERQVRGKRRLRLFLQLQT